MLPDPLELKLDVPTYHAHLCPERVERGELEEYGEPQVPVVIRDEAGVRVILGTHNSKDTSKPDLLIERQPKGWAIFLHPQGGGDPCGMVYFLDDGRSFLVPGSSVPSADNIVILKWDDPVPDFDIPAPPQTLRPSAPPNADTPWLVDDGKN